uniref:SWIM-type domain-containing protein n=1 Tax=viral metagenome TaxID=1070528 RepID=A0A6C0KBQ8_9ZZZZ
MNPTKQIELLKAENDKLRAALGNTLINQMLGKSGTQTLTTQAADSSDSDSDSSDYTNAADSNGDKEYFTSGSNGETYSVLNHPGGKWECNCAHFYYRIGKPVSGNYCKHIKKVIAAQ